MLALVAIALAVAGGTARAQGIVDQATTCNDGGSAQIQFHEPIAQRFRPRAPNLVAVELLLGRFNPPYTDTLTLRVLQGSVGGAFVAGTSRVVAAGASYAWFRFDLAAPVAVASGAPYVLELDATSSALGWAHQYELPPRCSYPDGEQLVAGAPVPGLDGAFRTIALCGNGSRDVAEQCDDGNRDDADGCTTACTVCGDRVVAPGEECDDGNLLSGDGCDANCMVSACGNGIVAGGEACDDGNRESGDCCSAACRLELAGAPCLDDGNVCTNDVCDGQGACVHPHNAAPCSDGNLCNGDDFCQGGACTGHVGNPCAGQPVCQRACIQTGPLTFQCHVDAGGTPCAPDADACTLDVCNGAGSCTHPAAPDGSACEDGDRCTTGDACRGGACRSGPPVPCDPCLVCDGGSGSCVPPTGLACAPAAPEKSSIVLRDSSRPASDKVVWKWRSRDAFGKSELGSPDTTTGLSLCVFDQTGLKLSARAPAGGTCAGKACWRELPAGYRYADGEATPDGLLKLQARAGGAGRGKITVKGRGPLLEMPALGLTAPVTVRLRRGDGAGCWESIYSTPVASDVIQFKARSD